MAPWRLVRTHAGEHRHVLQRIRDGQARREATPREYLYSARE